MKSRTIGAGGGVRPSQRSSQPLISREATERVKAAVDIVEVAQRYVQLRKVGENWVGRCPLHTGEAVGNKSLTVSPTYKNWKCWSCKKWGDVVFMVMCFEGVPFPVAVRLLANQAGLESILPAAP